MSSVVYPESPDKAAGNGLYPGRSQPFVALPSPVPPFRGTAGPEPMVEVTGL